MEQVNTALEDPENIRILYAVVEMAQKIDAVLDSITNSPSIPLWWDPTEKDRISQYCIASFGEELYRYTHTHFGAEPSWIASGSICRIFSPRTTFSFCSQAA